MPKRERFCRKVIDKKTGELCGQPYHSGGLCLEHYNAWARRKHSRFQRGVGGTKGGVIQCEACGRSTRETGEGETTLRLCRFCIRENYALNSFSDGEIDQQEYKEKLAEIAKEREAADG